MKPNEQCVLKYEQHDDAGKSAAVFGSEELTIRIPFQLKGGSGTSTVLPTNHVKAFSAKTLRGIASV